MKEINNDLIKKFIKILIVSNIALIGSCSVLVVLSEKKEQKKQELFLNMGEKEEQFHQNPNFENKKRVDSARKVFFDFIGERDSL